MSETVQMNVLVSSSAKDILKEAAKKEGMRLNEFIEVLTILIAQNPWIGPMAKNTTFERNLPMSEYTLKEVERRFRLLFNELAALEGRTDSTSTLENWLVLVSPQERVIYEMNPETKKVERRTEYW